MPSKTTSPAETANSLISLLNDRGTSDYIGEHISQLEHSLQCAHSAQNSGGDDEIILAALLHDIGQFLPLGEAKEMRMSISGEGSVGRVGHEMIGEEYLRSLGFEEKVCRLVGSHVAAKRYFPFPG
jgi:putative nucleotidyltransferase with HDIG domain